MQLSVAPAGVRDALDQLALDDGDDLFRRRKWQIMLEDRQPTTDEQAIALLSRRFKPYTYEPSPGERDAVAQTVEAAVVPAWLKRSTAAPRAPTAQRLESLAGGDDDLGDD